MEPYECNDLGVVGEGLWVIEGTQPLTQLRVSSKAANSAQPSPTGEGKANQFNLAIVSSIRPASALPS